MFRGNTAGFPWAWRHSHKITGGNHRNGNKSAAILRSRSDDCLSLNAHLAVRLLFNKRRTMLEHAIDNGRSVCPFVTLIIHA